eukprot:TRINITY_DN2751_c1_g1_i4.p1 TRINITY_DN2751_c1_g1~~TRINITY_DN2751_c1_g1_i4.p1  ORF type:complete len:538 (-),score=159.29 TRINITY_DN2751_c1_g1_i4:125-1738(-)
MSTPTPKVAPLAINKADLGFLIALASNSGLAFLFIILFCVLRKRFPDFYSPKIYVHRWRNTLPDTLFSWIPKMVARFSMSSILRENGLDVYMYFRFLRACLFIVSLLLLLSLVTLIPANATGGNTVLREFNYTINDNGTAVNSSQFLREQVTKFENVSLRGLEKITLQNIRDSSNVMWVHFFFTVFASVLICWVLFKDFKEFQSLRIRARETKKIENRTILLTHIQASNETDVKNYLSTVLPERRIEFIETVQIVRDVEDLHHLQERYERNLKKMERIKAKQLKNPHEILTHKVKSIGHPLGDKSTETNAIEYYERKAAELLRNIENVQGNFNMLEPKNAAFVTFTGKEMAQMLAQSEVSTRSGLIPQAFEAPEPRAVVWKWVGIGAFQFFIRTHLLHVSIFFMSLLWVIPISFFSSFTTIENLDKVVPKLVEVLEKNQALYGFVAGFLPVLLTIIFLALVPKIIRAAAMQAGFHSMTSVDRAVVNKFYGFLFINVLLGFLVGPVSIDLARNAGSLTFNRVLQIVSSSVPRQSKRNN